MPSPVSSNFFSPTPRQSPMLQRLAATQVREHLAGLRSLVERVQDLPELLLPRERAALAVTQEAYRARFKDQDRAPFTPADAAAVHALIVHTTALIRARAGRSAARSCLCALLVIRGIY